MKNYILIVILSLSFFISNSQNEEVNKTDSYILTTDGEKISIVPDVEITLGSKTVRYCSSKKFKKTRFLKKDVNKEIPIQTFSFEYKKIKIKNVEKIVNNDELYLPIKSKKGNKIYREVLKNETYTLGYYNFSVPGGSSLVLLIIDNKTNEEVDRVYIGGNGKQHNTIEKNIALVKKYFGKCFKEDEFIVNEHTEPYKIFLKGEESTEEKEKEWNKFIKGSFINIGWLLPSFEVLPNYNQYQCK